MSSLQNSKKLYVGNLPYSLTTEDLRNLFAEFGTIVDVTVIMDRATNRSKGFGFVEFDSEDAAQAAIKGMADKDVEGRKLVVNVARAPKDR